MSDNKLPERITAIRSVTYDVNGIKETLDGLIDDPNIEDIMEVIESYIMEDLSCGWGHEVKLKDVIFKDENGEEL